MSREFNQETIKLLKRIHSQSRHFQVRNRAHCLLLRNKGFTIAQLAVILEKSEKTIFNWLKSWNNRGLLGLYNHKGQGRKATFNKEEKEKIKELVQKEPKQLKKVLVKIEEKWQKKISKKTLTRIIKSLRMSWHRLRRVCGGEPCPTEYQEKKEELERLKKLDEQREIDLYYLDESGFSLVTNVPSAWQNIGEYIGIKSSKSKRMNVLGIMNRRKHLESYVSLQSINSDVVINCIETFFSAVERRTVIVMDQASIHTGDLIWDYVEEWKERGIEIFILPSYSPELNLIENLWRFMKYEWLEIEAYLSWENLVLSVENILSNYGTEYVINFV